MLFIKKIKYKLLQINRIKINPIIFYLRFFFKKKLINLYGLEKKNSSNIALYDLRNNSVTFDFVHFLSGASFFFKNKGEVFSLIIVNDNCELNSNTSWENYAEIIDNEKQLTRVYKMLLPIAFCFNQCKNSIKIISPEDLPCLINKSDILYPKKSNNLMGKVMEYKETFNFIFNTNYDPNISSPSHYKSKVNDFLNEINITKNIEFDSFITLTLRSYDFQQGRNTMPKDIEFIGNFCKKNNLILIVIPDTDKKPTNTQLAALNKFHFLIWDSPSVCIFLRLALYEKSKLNLMNLNGPMCLAIYASKSKTVILNFGDDTHKSNAGKIFSRKEYGIEEYSQPYKRFSCLVQWDKNNDDELQKHIKYLCPEIIF